MSNHRRLTLASVLVFAAHFLIVGAVFGSLAGCKPHHQAPSLGSWYSAGVVQDVCR